MSYKCLQCISEYIVWENGDHVAEEPVVEAAITLAPAWQMQQMGAQQVVACVTVPSCRRHLEVKKMSALEQAMSGGRLLQGG